MKKLTFLVGRAHTGKSACIYKKIIENESAGKRSLLIVPPRYTFEVERGLSELSGCGVMNTAICSFQTLVRKVLDEAGDRRVFMSELGRLLVVKKSLFAADLTLFSGVAQRPGFAKKIDELMADFANASVTPNQLHKLAESIDGDVLLKHKLTDLAQIYSLTYDYLDAHQLNPTDAYNVAVNAISTSELCGADVFIDGAGSQSEQTYRVTESLMSRANSLTVTIRADLDDSCNDFDLFRPELNYMHRLKQISGELGYEAQVIDMRQGKDAYAQQELAHIDKNLYAYPYSRFSGDCNAVEVFAAGDIMQEARAVTAAIREAAMEGVRYRDMALICTDEAKYSVIIRQLFKDADIPAYFDLKHRLDTMNVSVLIISALRCVSEGYPRDAVFSLMKTGLCGVTRDEAEILENYMLQYGVYGSDLKQTFKAGNVPKEAHFARKKIIEPLEQLRNECSRGTVAEKTDALCAYLKKLHVREQLVELTKALRSAKRYEPMETCAQVYNAVMDLLEQLRTVMSDERISNARFTDIVREGLDAQVVSSIPAGVDNVLFGTTENTMPRGVKRLFVIGAYEGVLPKKREDAGIIDDGELSKMKESGLNLWDDTEANAERDKLDVYTLLTLPSERLYISYPMIADSKDVMPCAVLDKILKLFPELKVRSNLDINPPHRLLDTHALSDAMRAYADTGDVKGAPLYAWYRSRTDNKAMLSNLKRALFYSASPDNLDYEFALELYDNGLYASPSELEQFNNCPFAHFMKYGLRAKERKEYVAKNTDIGSFAHAVLQAFADYIVVNDIDINTLDKERCCEITDELIAPIASEYKNGVLTQSERGLARLRRYSDMLKNTAWAIVRQMRMGSFKFLATEAEFGDDKQFPALEITLRDGRVFKISGKVDRIDKTADNEFRVIDYKLHGREMVFSDIYHGLSLQLPLYTAALEAASSANVTVGMYYMPILQHTVKADSVGKDIERAIMAAFKLSGLSVMEYSIVEKTDAQFALNPAEAKDSAVIIAKPVKDTAKDTATASLISKETMERVKKFALKKAAATVSSMLEGNIRVFPVNKGNNRTSCEYCPYNGVCTFDTEFVNCTYRAVNKVTLNELFVNGDDV